MKTRNYNNLKLRNFNDALDALCAQYNVEIGAINATLDVYDLDSEDYITYSTHTGTDYTNFN